MPSLLSGFATGMLLQAAVGPVFFLVLNITVQRTMTDGFLSVAAVTLADFLYVSLAVLGAGRLLERPRVKFFSGFLSAVILIAFGIVMAAQPARDTAAASLVSPGPAWLVSFTSAFVLTLSSPLTIVFWTSLFAAKAIEKGFQKKQLFAFGFGAVLSTPFFLGSAVIVLTLVKTSVPPDLIRVLNFVVGLILIGYGLFRLVKTAKDRKVSVT